MEAGKCQVAFQPSARGADSGHETCWSSRGTGKKRVISRNNVAASDSQVWFTTSEIAEWAGMTMNEWRDAPRKLPQHLKANYPNVPRAENVRLAWPLLAWSLTNAELSWAMPPETKAAWRKIRGI